MIGKYVRGLFVLSAVMLLASGCAESDKTANMNIKNEDNKEESIQQSVEKGAESYFNATGTRICDETITITMSGPQGATKDWQNTDQIKQIEEQFGIHIDCKPIGTDAWNTQRTLMFTTDSLPDLVVSCGLNVSLRNSYGLQGYLLPINEYLDYMPNLKKVLQENPEYEKAITAPDGNIYGIPQIVNTEPKGPDELPRVYVNKEWLKNVGMEAPETISELYDVLKAFKEEDANGNGDPDDEVPMLFNDSNAYWYAKTPILGAFGIYNNEKDFHSTIDNSGTVSIGNLTEDYKEYLFFMRKLYQEELIDSECFIFTKGEVESKAANNLYGVIGTPSSPGLTCQKGFINDFDWELIPVFVQNSDDSKIVTQKISKIGVNTKM